MLLVPQRDIPAFTNVMDKIAFVCIDDLQIYTRYIYLITEDRIFRSNKSLRSDK